MNNKQLFDLTSPPSAEFDTVQELLWYCNNHAKQNGYAVATKNSKREKNITIKCDFVGKYREVQKHPMAEKRRQTSSRLENCPFEICGKNMLMESGDLLSKYQIITILLLHLRHIQCINIWMRPNLNQSLLWLKLVWGLSKTCPECASIMVIQKPVLEESAMEGTCNADPVSSNNFYSRERRTVICVNCGGNHYRKTHCWNRNL